MGRDQARLGQIRRGLLFAQISPNLAASLGKIRREQAR